MDARNVGILRITDRCTFLERDGERKLLVWPADRTRWNPGDRSIAFETRAGQVAIMRDGDEVVLGGGASTAQLNWVVGPAAECLLGIRWEVSDAELSRR
jgi:hypothetical protein